MPAREWMPLAACRPTEPEIFFPTRGDRDEYLEETAKAVCGACPVREPCLAEAIRRDESEGIWGGLTPHQRRWLAGQARRLVTLGAAETARRTAHRPAGQRGVLEP